MQLHPVQIHAARLGTTGLPGTRLNPGGVASSIQPTPDGSSAPPARTGSRSGTQRIPDNQDHDPGLGAIRTTTASQ